MNVSVFLVIGFVFLILAILFILFTQSFYMIQGTKLYSNAMRIMVPIAFVCGLFYLIRNRITTVNIKKVLLSVFVFLILIAFLISFLLMQIGSKLNINLEFVMLFGWFTLACLIINESRSIIENLVEIGIDVPEILTKGLNVYESVLKSKSKALTNDDKKEGE